MQCWVKIQVIFETSFCPFILPSIEIKKAYICAYNQPLLFTGRFNHIPWNIISCVRAGETYAKCWYTVKMSTAIINRKLQSLEVYTRDGAKGAPPPRHLDQWNICFQIVFRPKRPKRPSRKFFFKFNYFLTFCNYSLMSLYLNK